MNLTNPTTKKHSIKKERKDKQTSIIRINIRIKRRSPTQIPNRIQTHLPPTRPEKNLPHNRRIPHHITPIPPRPRSQNPTTRRNRHLNRHEMGHPPISLAKHRAQMEKNPIRRPILPVIQQANLHRLLLPDRLPNLGNGSPIGPGPLKDPPVPTQNLLPRVPGHLQEPDTRVDDRVPGDARIRDEEADGQLVQSFTDQLRVATTQRLVDRTEPTRTEFGAHRPEKPSTSDFLLYADRSNPQSHVRTLVPRATPAHFSLIPSRSESVSLDFLFLSFFLSFQREILNFYTACGNSS